MPVYSHIAHSYPWAIQCTQSVHQYVFENWEEAGQPWTLEEHLKPKLSEQSYLLIATTSTRQRFVYVLSKLRQQKYCCCEIISSHYSFQASWVRFKPPLLLKATVCVRVLTHGDNERQLVFDGRAAELLCWINNHLSERQWKTERKSTRERERE